MLSNPRASAFAILGRTVRILSYAFAYSLVSGYSTCRWLSLVIRSMSQLVAGLAPRNVYRGRRLHNISRLSNYPVVFVPGLATDGSRFKQYFIVPEGMSPYGSSHDRAVELFYYLKGGRIDYGRDHAKKYGHRRYGRSFEGALTEWSDLRPIVVISHSHGGNTVRILQRLLATRYFADHPETSASWIRAIVCVASPLNGCPLLYAIGMPRRSTCNSMKLLNGTELGQTTGRWWSVIRIGQAIGYSVHFFLGDSTFARSIYDWGLQKWEITCGTTGCGTWFKILLGTHTVMRTDDTAGYDLTTEGASALNSKCSLYAGTYYFTIPCVNGQIWNDRFLPFTSRCFWMLPIGLANAFCVESCSRTPERTGNYDWRLNDLLVPTASQIHPLGDPHCFLSLECVKRGTKISKGQWNVLPVVDCDHYTSSELSTQIISMLECVVETVA